MFRIFFFLQNLLVDNRAQRDDSIAPSRPRIDCTNKKADFFSWGLNLFADNFRSDMNVRTQYAN